MKEKIEVEGIFETKDYRRTALALYFSFNNFIYNFLAFVIYGFFIIFFLLERDAGFWAFGDIVLTSAVFFVLFNLIMARSAVINGERLVKSLNDEKCRFAFSSEGFEISATTFSSFVSWKRHKEIKETKKYFILLSKDGRRVLLPKRFFRDDAQISEFKDLLRAHVKENIRLKN